ncbi:MAG: RsmD family RNA methyltransferase [Acidimicrobiales bacterium]
MRVVSGTAKGRRLQAPPGSDVRPTSDRVREAVFDILGSLGGVATLTVTDLFAGTGALGIEALSRGAAAATFVDHDPAALGSLRVNLVSTGLYSRATVVEADVLSWLPGSSECHVAFADPPYTFADWDELVTGLRADLVVIESNHEVPAPPGWSTEKTRHYGGTVLTLLRPASPDESEGS